MYPSSITTLRVPRVLGFSLLIIHLLMLVEIRGSARLTSKEPLPMPGLGLGLWPSWHFLPGISKSTSAAISWWRPSYRYRIYLAVRLSLRVTTLRKTPTGMDPSIYQVLQ